MIREQTRQVLLAKVPTDRAFLSRQIRKAGARSQKSGVRIRFRSGQFCKHPAVPRVPHHLADLVSSGHFAARQRQNKSFGRETLDVHASLIPDVDASLAESFLFNIFPADGFYRETLPLDRKSPFSRPEWRLFQEGPGAQNSLQDNAQIVMRPAGFMLMDHKSRICRAYQVLAPNTEM